MAEETAETESTPLDFAEVALGIATTDPDAPKPETATSAEPTTKQATDKPQRPSGTPEALQPKKEEAKTEPEPELETSKIKAPEFKDPKRKAQWDELHGKASTFEKELRAERAIKTDLEKRIAEYESKGKNTDALEKELEASKKQLAEYAEIVKQTAVDHDPQFREKYIDGRNNKVKEIQDIINDAGGDASEVVTALALKGRARVDALRLISDELPGYLQGLLGTAIRELDTLDKEAEGIRSSSAKYLEERERQTLAQKQQAEIESFKVQELGWQRAQAKAKALFAEFNKVDGNDEWNAKVDAIVAKAESNYKAAYQGLQTPEQDAEMMLRAAAADAIREKYVAMSEYAQKIEKINEEQAAELKKLYGTTPDLRGRQSSNGEKAAQEMDFASRTIDLMAGA